MTKKKVLIVEGLYKRRKGVINKDVNAGLGTCTNIGDSIFAKVLERFKKNGVALPLLDFAYLSALLRKNGHETFYRKASSGNELMEIIQKEGITDIVFHPGLVDFTNEIRICKEIKQLFPNIRAGAFGPFVSIRPDLFEPYFDWILTGEFEDVLLKRDFSELKGVIHNHTFMEDIDQLPFPDWSIFSGIPFSYKPLLNDTPFFTMQGSRGCPMSCAKYCPYPTSQGKKWRARSVASVIQEIKHNIKTYGMKSFLFRDAFFSLSKPRTIEFANAMIKEKFGIKWGCETRLDSLNKEIIDLLYAAGMRSLNLGIESSDANILTSAGRKPFSHLIQEDLISHCYNLGIKVNTFFILGLMEDNADTIIRTIRHACSLKSFTCQFTINTPLPGKEYFEEMKEHLIDDNLEHFDNNTLVIKHPNLTPEKLKQLHEKAFVSYYFRPEYIARFVKWKIRDALSS